ncbi:carboxylic acid reductase [Mycobacterium sp. UM_CSW]|uniref:carboxylic acid reductase n=1 Tax=Mycobacterium sp. UM_CSW TaxID=1370119 RepID=UPI00040611A7|nr:carboxylic acid reductase [Mycobacterium sp. UM_CSW]
MATDAPTDMGQEALWRRIDALTATDAQLAAACPDPAVATGISAPGLRLSEVVHSALQGYSDRPALGQRRVEYRADPVTGRSSVELLPTMTTISYGELWEHAIALVAVLAGSVRPGDRVCMLGFTSVDYTTIDLALMLIGAVAVPLQTNAPVASLGPIVEETEPVVVACSADFLADGSRLLEFHSAALLLVFDFHARADDHRDALDAAQARAAGLSAAPKVMTLADAIEDGSTLPTPIPELPDNRDALALLLYTSGSTGTPKGAMYTEELLAEMWQNAANVPVPSIILSFMPMSHMFGRGTLYMTLAAGGTAYFAAKSDLSSFLDDLALVRPSFLYFVPRVWDMLYQEFQSRLARRASEEGDFEMRAAELRADFRQNVLGGRAIVAMTASAPISPELRDWAEKLVGMPLRESYGATEVRGVLVNGRVQRPPVIDYKLVDVPELGYFSTDRPYPRGELYVKSRDAVAGYYKRPELTAEVFDAEGWYHTGDIVAEVEPDRLDYVDRRNNVLKLSQGEFVTVSQLETVFGHSPLVRQIYLYVNSSRPYLLAVVVPPEEALAAHDPDTLKPLIAESMREAAHAAGLQPYEIPRDFIVETTPFSLENGLLTGIRKLAWPTLKQRYGPALEGLYAELSERQDSELRDLRRTGNEKPVLETVSRAAAVLLGATTSDVRPDAHFTDLGGDSLSALTFANLLHDIYEIDVPVGVIVSPATDLSVLADYIEAQRRPGAKRSTFASVHGRDARIVRATDLTLDKFLDDQFIASAPTLPPPDLRPRTVLLTGATGFLGRYLALQWLERMDRVDGNVVCLVRAKDDAAARTRMDATFDSGDDDLLRHYRELAADHLEVLAGDKGEADLGLRPDDWRRLSETVDAIVDPAALVNHVLPYSQLFGPNALGTAELIRMALTDKLKPYTYVSTVAVGTQVEPARFLEDADIREISPSRTVDDSYANGYANSKWAGEVLLREAHDLCGLPVTVFRSNMILAEPRYAGQLNVPDMFSRLILSVVASGLAPKSFYALDGRGNRQPAHYDGLPVDFTAEAIAELGAGPLDGFQTYHVMNPHEDGIGLDDYVDWLIDAGHPIRRIDDHADWVNRFETALRALPERQRQASLLPLMAAFRQPLPRARAAFGAADRFRKAVQDAKLGIDQDIPHVTAPIIVKYVADLNLLGML